MTRLRLCFIGPAASISLRRWTEWFADRGHQCTVMTVEPAVPAQAVKFKQINLATSCWPRKIGRIVSVLKMIRCIRGLRPDLVHIHYLRGLTWGLLADMPHPCVVTPWGSDVLTDQGAYREWYSKDLTGRLLRRADLVTTHSRYMEAQVRALVSDVQPIVRVGWGVDLQRFRPNIDTESLRRRWGIQADQPVVFSPRLLQALYNHEYIIQALPRLRRAIPNVIVVFTDYFADLAYKHRLQRLASELDVTESIRFVGDVSHEEMPFWFNLAKAVTMMPASDGLPNSLLEAMACGVTPVLNELPQYDELVQDRVNGRRAVLDASILADVLVEVLRDDAFRAQCLVTNRGLMESVGDQDKEMGKMEGLYRGLVKSAGRIEEWGARSCAR